MKGKAYLGDALITPINDPQMGSLSLHLSCRIQLTTHMGAFKPLYVLHVGLGSQSPDLPLKLLLETNCWQRPALGPHGCI
jgi:hypothetical protein